MSPIRVPQCSLLGLVQDSNLLPLRPTAGGLDVQSNSLGASRVALTDKAMTDPRKKG
jgi:hypothetical protein